MGGEVAGVGVEVVWGEVGWYSFNRYYCGLGHDRQMKRFNRPFNFSVELWEIIFKTLMYTC